MRPRRRFPSTPLAVAALSAALVALAAFRASFSSSLGYPAYAQVDPVASVLDDEFIVETFSFTVETP